MSAAAGASVPSPGVARVEQALAWLRALPPVEGRRRDLQLDSRRIRHGDVFVAIPGERSDGRQHLAEAARRGAAAALVEAEGWERTEADLPQHAVAGLRASLGALASDWYGRPSERMLSIGVTGTNGKTSCSQWIAQLLTREGRRCAVIGTVGIGFAGALRPSDLTTPDPLSLQRELRELLDAGAQAVAMEVSSIGLAQQRVDGMSFDIALFTNLTRDHLDFHGTMERYEAAKALLFDWPGLRHAVVNLDDPAGCRIAAQAAARGVDVLGTSAGGDASPRPLAPRLLAQRIRATGDGLAFDLRIDGVLHAVEVGLVGHFNVANLLSVVGASIAAGVDPTAAVAALPHLVPPPGRMQRVDASAQPLVVVDYAHTPDALTQALAALRPLAQARGGRLWVVFGAGGDRDPGKRAPMGAAAAAAADVVVITSDNPRTEDPGRIVAQVAAGAGTARELLIEPERGRAIDQAVARAGMGDVVLIAGKGHEQTQIIGAAKLPFSDVDRAGAALRQRAKAVR